MEEVVAEVSPVPVTASVMLPWVVPVVVPAPTRHIAARAPPA